MPPRFPIHTRRLVGIAFVAGCGGGLAEPVPWLEVADALSFTARVGEPNLLEVPVLNTGTAEANFTATVSPPMTMADARYRLQPNAEQNLSVLLNPDDFEPVDGELTLRLGQDEWTVALSVVVLTDLDGDGEPGEASGGLDCNDEDPLIGPAQTERCNEVDDDCDGEVDEGLDLTTRWPDADGDGSGDPTAASRDDCGPVDGWVTNQLDCDDNDENAAPGMPEVWYDGLDQACDGGSDFDQDDDGYDREPEGDDCLDERDDAYPGAEEVADGADNDCDGGRDEETLVEEELVFTELFFDPDSTAVVWFELHNPGTTIADLALGTLEVDGEPLVLPALVLAPGDVVLFCSDDDPLTNGGLDCDGAIALPTGARRVHLLGPEASVDEVDASTWAFIPGRSLELGSSVLDAASNDDESAWCTGVSLFGDASGDRGTPGALQPPC